MRKTQLESQHLLIYPPKNNAHYSCVCVSSLYFICIECVCDIHVNAIINFIYTHALVKDTRTHVHSYLYTHTQSCVNIKLTHVGGRRNTQKLITCHNDYILQRH